MRIPEETVERIRQAAEIVEVVGDFVSLKRRGSNYIACCPFHNEKSPSFNVNPARQIYKCFGCGKAGDSVRFIMDVENLGYGEALRYLAKKYNIEIEEQEVTPEEQLKHTERESLYIVLNYAKTFFQDHLLKSEEGRGIGLSYFRERGFSDPTIAAFDLGYSPDQWDALLKDAQTKGYNPELLNKAGLTVTREESGKIFDRFRGRVMFPIHNVSGRVIAFGARILKPDPKAPKYLNSPETEAYHKSQVLYGIFQAKQTIRQEDVCYLTEGYTDVISLHQAGIKNVVASSGTSLTIEQIRLISRFTQNVTILYDGDAAGVKAALRGLDMVLEEGLNVSVATFPNGDDPDSYVRKVGAEAFKAYLSQYTQDFIAFKTAALLKDAGDNPFKRAEVITEIVGSITRIPDPIKRQVFFQSTARQLSVDEQTLISESNRLLRKQHDTQVKDYERQQERDARIDARNATRDGGNTSQRGPGPVSNRPGPNDFPPDDFFNDFLDEAGISPAPKEDNVPAGQNGTGQAAPGPGGKPTPSLTPPGPDTTRPPLAYQEEECIRLLMNYGTRELEPGITLCHYILSELNDIDFQHAPYDLILTLFREAFSRGDTLTADDFVQQRPTVSENPITPQQANGLQYQAISLTTQRYEISNQWQDKFHIFVPSEEDIGVLAEAAYGNILRLKKLIAEERMHELLQKIRTVKDPVESDQLMADYMHFKRVDVEIARLLGTVISG
ncbi:DNA primase [Fibrivirga algicola]|uniref:DNA primase n=1 Tax=Fibrivirga algicola TaxID=2950420 RepID=A0ABX0QDS6_9BACT|nr:DNA primase [Fibrivirga algicola]ARK09653.1 DNA primase [Fibrella sp. ES10-3-2-2]NID10540.1 DNA primase [Fibrivirga algicola]